MYVGFVQPRGKTLNMMRHNLALEFHRRLKENPRRVALVVDGTKYDYERLGSFAGSVAAWLRAAAGPKKEFRVGILAARSLDAIGGILGTVWAGFTYVPFNVKTPPDRLIALLKRVPLDAVIIDGSGAACVTEAVRGYLPDKVLAPSGPLEIPGLTMSDSSALNPRAGRYARLPAVHIRHDGPSQGRDHNGRECGGLPSRHQQLL
jgi:acyl-CoA synthetase (AMP-forming)/AMP-acid ligase II